MARPLRVEHEDAVYHILSRGNKADFIFQEDADKKSFLDILEKAASKYHMEVYAYCIMGNHYHLLAGIPIGNLSRAMHTIQSSYGSYMRRERKWIGHVFAGRFKSLCVEKEGYLLELSRYIHLNPVRAGIVKSPEEYSWSSYRYYTGRDKKRPNCLKMEWLLQEYGDTHNIARKKYKEFVGAGIKNAVTFPVESVMGQAILGSKVFFEMVLRQVEKEKELQDVISKRLFIKSIALDELYRAVCRFYRVREISKGREGGSSGDMFVYLAKTHSNALNNEIGQKAGGITFSAVAQRYARTVKKLEHDRKAMDKWQADAESIMSKVKG